MKKFVYFPRGSQNETVSNLFGDVFSRSFNVIGQFMKKCCLLLFSISVAIGQFSSKRPGSSSCTVKVQQEPEEARFLSILTLFRPGIFLVLWACGTGGGRLRRDCSYD